MTRKRFALLLALAAFSLTIHAADPQTDPHAPNARPVIAAGTKNVGPAEFERLRQDKTNVVLDVRTPREFAAGHIPGAVNIDVNDPDFEKKVSALDKNKTYLVHCAAGVRSAKACDRLSKLSFPHLYNLEGGMKAWEKAGNQPQR